jgi:hypothetical protein
LARGRPPIFESGRPTAHVRTRQEMRQILEEDTELGFLDAGAQELLSEAREFYRDARLGDRMVLIRGSGGGSL